MPKDHLPLFKSSLAFAKLTATPTDSAWSQAYNAGNLFACLSLNAENGEDPPSLQTLGKELFNNLEAEFFTLEEKNLTTIADAVSKSIKHIPENVSVDFCLAYFKDSALYLFILGEGRVMMKRGEKLGLLLEKIDQSDKQIKTSSGYLQNNDTIILQTSKFAKNIANEHILDSLQLSLPSDIAESLSVHMHEKPDGDQAAIIIVYHAIEKPALEEIEEDEVEQSPLPSPTREDLSPPAHSPSLPKLPSLPSFPALPRLPYLNHRKKLFLSISLIILALLLISIFLTKQKQETSKNSQVFASIYPPALKSYEEAVELKNLNETLSREDFLKAEKFLVDGRDKFPEGSEEDKQIEELLVKVQSELGSGGQQINTKETTPDANSILALQKANANALGFSQNTDNVYFVTNDAIFAVDKKSGEKTELIKNDDAWEKAVSTAPFQANLYVLDAQNGIIKFVPASDSFTSSDYLKGSDDLSKAVSMAIDSAVWVLFSDGTINKYLRGEKQDFSIKGLDKPLASPTKLATDENTDSLYILDRGNSRIVQLGKDGAFQKQFNATVIKDAKDFEVLEKDKKIHILAKDKIWEIAL